jgi:hypothetical protein
LSTGPPTGAAVFRIGTEVQTGRLAQRQVARTGDVADLGAGGIPEIGGGVPGVKRGIRGPIRGLLVDADDLVRSGLGVHAGKFSAAARTKNNQR